MIRFLGCAIVAAYGAFACLLVGEAAEAVGLVSWAIAPLALQQAIVLTAAKPRTRSWALVVLLLIALTGAIALFWGLYWNPGDYNHLVIIFLPLYQFGFLALAFAAFRLASLGLLREPTS